MCLDKVTHVFGSHGFALITDDMFDFRLSFDFNAINKMLEQTDQGVVVPQLVSYDPMFQERIVGRATKESADPSRVLYSADAILPDPEVGNWVVRISNELLNAQEKQAS